MQSPLTGSYDVSLLKKLSTRRLIEDWKTTYGFDISNEFHCVEEIEVYQCNQTGLVFFAPPEVTGSEHLYEQLEKIEWYYSANRWEHKMAITRLFGFEKILEVGSGSGLFVKMASEVGLDVRGIEINSSAVQEAQKRGLSVELLDLKVASTQNPASFDAVCSFQVLEHVSNVGEFIKYSLDLLKPGGKLIFCVPNGDSYLRLYHEPLNFPPHHMTHWSRSTFKTLEQHFGMKLDRCLNEPFPFWDAERRFKIYESYYGPRSFLGKALFNRFTYRMFRHALRLGFSRFLSGQSLYVEFNKNR